jgi:hypothetical protein
MTSGRSDAFIPLVRRANGVPWARLSGEGEGQK